MVICGVIVSETEICGSSSFIVVGVGPNAWIVAAVASMPVSAYDEFGGELLACALPAVAIVVVQV